MKFFTVFVAVVALAACSTPVPDRGPEAAAPDPATTGTITGTIVVNGTVPPPGMMRIDGDPKCVALAGSAQQPTEDLVVDGGNRLQNVFVYVKEGLPARMYRIPSEPVVLDQQRCRYAPRVLGLQVGQALTIRNGDPLLHNVRAEGAINESFDIGTPVQGMEVTRTFATREVMVPVKCNVHGWMHAYIGVLEHPYFGVSDGGGRFSIAQLPAGTYTLEFWHERLGTQTQQVTVTASETTDVTLAYTVS